MARRADSISGLLHPAFPPPAARPRDALWAPPETNEPVLPAVTAPGDLGCTPLLGGGPKLKVSAQLCAGATAVREPSGRRATRPAAGNARGSSVTCTASPQAQLPAGAIPVLGDGPG